MSFWQNIYSAFPLVLSTSTHTRSQSERVAGAFPSLAHTKQRANPRIYALCGCEATNKFGPLRSPPPPPPTHPKFADLIRAGINCRAAGASARNINYLECVNSDFQQQITARARFQFRLIELCCWCHTLVCIPTGAHMSRNRSFSAECANASENINALKVKNKTAQIQCCW